MHLLFSFQVSVREKVEHETGCHLPTWQKLPRGICSACYHLVNEIDVLEHKLTVYRSFLAANVHASINESQKKDSKISAESDLEINSSINQSSSTPVVESNTSDTPEPSQQEASDQVASDSNTIRSIPQLQDQSASVDKSDLEKEDSVVDPVQEVYDNSTNISFPQESPIPLTSKAEHLPCTDVIVTSTDSIASMSPKSVKISDSVLISVSNVLNSVNSPYYSPSNYASPLSSPTHAPSYQSPHIYPLSPLPSYGSILASYSHIMPQAPYFSHYPQHSPCNLSMLAPVGSPSPLKETPLAKAAEHNLSIDELSSSSKGSSTSNTIINSHVDVDLSVDSKASPFQAESLPPDKKIKNTSKHIDLPSCKDINNEPTALDCVKQSEEGRDSQNMNCLSEASQSDSDVTLDTSISNNILSSSVCPISLISPSLPYASSYVLPSTPILSPEDLINQNSLVSPCAATSVVASCEGSPNWVQRHLGTSEESKGSGISVSTPTSLCLESNSAFETANACKNAVSETVSHFPTSKPLSRLDASEYASSIGKSPLHSTSNFSSYSSSETVALTSKNDASSYSFQGAPFSHSTVISNTNETSNSLVSSDYSPPIFSSKLAVSTRTETISSSRVDHIASPADITSVKRNLKDQTSNAFLNLTGSVSQPSIGYTVHNDNSTTSNLLNYAIGLNSKSNCSSGTDSDLNITAGFHSAPRNKQGSAYENFYGNLTNNMVVTSCNKDLRKNSDEHDNCNTEYHNDKGISTSTTVTLSATDSFNSYDKTAQNTSCESSAETGNKISLSSVSQGICSMKRLLDSKVEGTASNQTSKPNQFLSSVPFLATSVSKSVIPLPKSISPIPAVVAMLSPIKRMPSSRFSNANIPIPCSKSLISVLSTVASMPDVNSLYSAPTICSIPSFDSSPTIPLSVFDNSTDISASRTSSSAASLGYSNTLQKASITVPNLKESTSEGPLNSLGCSMVLTSSQSYLRSCLNKNISVEHNGVKDSLITSPPLSLATVSEAPLGKDGHSTAESNLNKGSPSCSSKQSSVSIDSNSDAPNLTSESVNNNLIECSSIKGVPSIQSDVEILVNDTSEIAESRISSRTRTSYKRKLRNRKIVVKPKPAKPYSPTKISITKKGRGEVKFGNFPEKRITRSVSKKLNLANKQNLLIVDASNKEQNAPDTQTSTNSLEDCNVSDSILGTSTHDSLNWSSLKNDPRHNFQLSFNQNVCKSFASTSSSTPSFVSNVSHPTCSVQNGDFQTKAQVRESPVSISIQTSISNPSVDSVPGTAGTLPKKHITYQTQLPDSITAYESNKLSFQETIPNNDQVHFNRSQTNSYSGVYDSCNSYPAYQTYNSGENYPIHNRTTPFYKQVNFTKNNDAVQNKDTPPYNIQPQSSNLYSLPADVHANYGSHMNEQTVSNNTGTQEGMADPFLRNNYDFKTSHQFPRTSRSVQNSLKSTDLSNCNHASSQTTCSGSQFGSSTAIPEMNKSCNQGFYQGYNSNDLKINPKIPKQPNQLITQNCYSNSSNYSIHTSTSVSYNPNYDPSLTQLKEQSKQSIPFDDKFNAPKQNQNSSHGSSEKAYSLEQCTKLSDNTVQHAVNSKNLNNCCYTSKELVHPIGPTPANGCQSNVYPENNSFQMNLAQSTLKHNRKTNNSENAKANLLSNKAGYAVSVNNNSLLPSSSNSESTSRTVLSDKPIIKSAENSFGVKKSEAKLMNNCLPIRQVPECSKSQQLFSQSSNLVNNNSNSMPFMIPCDSSTTSENLMKNQSSHSNLLSQVPHGAGNLINESVCQSKLSCLSNASKIDVSIELQTPNAVHKDVPNSSNCLSSVSSNKSSSMEQTSLSTSLENKLNHKIMGNLNNNSLTQGSQNCSAYSYSSIQGQSQYIFNKHVNENVLRGNGSTTQQLTQPPLENSVTNLNRNSTINASDGKNFNPTDNNSNAQLRKHTSLVRKSSDTYQTGMTNQSDKKSLEQSYFKNMQPHGSSQSCMKNAHVNTCNPVLLNNSHIHHDPNFVNGFPLQNQMQGFAVTGQNCHQYNVNATANQTANRIYSVNDLSTCGTNFIPHNSAENMMMPSSSSFPRANAEQTHPMHLQNSDIHMPNGYPTPGSSRNFPLRNQSAIPHNNIPRLEDSSMHGNTLPLPHVPEHVPHTNLHHTGSLGMDGFQVLQPYPQPGPLNSNNGNSVANNGMSANSSRGVPHNASKDVTGIHYNAQNGNNITHSVVNYDTSMQRHGSDIRRHSSNTAPNGYMSTMNHGQQIQEVIHVQYNHHMHQTQNVHEMVHNPHVLPYQDPNHCHIMNEHSMQYNNNHTNQVYIQQSYNDVHCMQNSSMHMYAEYPKPTKHHSQTQTVDYVPNGCNVPTPQMYQDGPSNSYPNTIPVQPGDNKAMPVSGATNNETIKGEKVQEQIKPRIQSSVTNPQDIVPASSYSCDTDESQITQLLEKNIHDRKAHASKKSIHEKSPVKNVSVQQEKSYQSTQLELSNYKSSSTKANLQSHGEHDKENKIEKVSQPSSSESTKRMCPAVTSCDQSEIYQCGVSDNVQPASEIPCSSQSTIENCMSSDPPANFTTNTFCSETASHELAKQFVSKLFAGVKSENIKLNQSANTSSNVQKKGVSDEVSLVASNIETFGTDTCMESTKQSLNCFETSCNSSTFPSAKSSSTDAIEPLPITNLSKITTETDIDIEKCDFVDDYISVDVNRYARPHSISESSRNEHENLDDDSDALTETLAEAMSVAGSTNEGCAESDSSSTHPSVAPSPSIPEKPSSAPPSPIASYESFTRPSSPELLRNVQEATEYHKPTLLMRSFKSKKHAKLQTCRQCDQVFSTRQCLIRHIERRHKPTALQYTCQICHKKFNSEKMLTKHTQQHETRTCKLCNKSFMQLAKLKKHMKEHTQQSLACTYCNLQCTSIQALISHINSHKRVKPQYICDVCNKSYANNRNLEVHKRIHTGERPHVCQNCNKSFSVRSNMIAHRELCLGQCKFNCSICNRGFPLESLYKRHMDEHEGKYPHACKVCHKGFSKLSGLKNHSKTHEPKKKLGCSSCNIEFANSTDLKLHMKEHNFKVPKQFKCPVCSKVLGRADRLKVHLARHSNKRNYECSQCNKSFFYKCNLKSHIYITHMGEKPHSCPYCTKSFGSKYNFNVHLTVHTSEKPYKCGDCGKEFATKPNYKRHLKCHATASSVCTNP